jgi:hypothetical protein
METPIEYRVINDEGLVSFVAAPIHLGINTTIEDIPFNNSSGTTGEADHEDLSDETSMGDAPFMTGTVLTTHERDVIGNLVYVTLPSTASTVIKSVFYLKALHRQVFDVRYRKDLSSQNRLTPMRRILYACVVRQVIINEAKPLPTEDELRSMPFYAEDDLVPPTPKEVLSLCRFLRAIQTLKDIGLPGDNNKQTYIDVANMLDGSNRACAYGGAPSKATIRRAMIFHAVMNTETTCPEAESRAKRRRVCKINPG